MCCDGYIKQSLHSGCAQHQMSALQNDELWVDLLDPPLQSHNFRRQEHVVLAHVVRWRRVRTVRVLLAFACKTPEEETVDRLMQHWDKDAAWPF